MSIRLHVWTEKTRLGHTFTELAKDTWRTSTVLGVSWMLRKIFAHTTKALSKWEAGSSVVLALFFVVAECRWQIQHFDSKGSNWCEDKQLAWLCFFKLFQHYNLYIEDIDVKGSFNIFQHLQLDADEIVSTKHQRHQQVQHQTMLKSDGLTFRAYLSVTVDGMVWSNALPVFFVRQAGSIGRTLGKWAHVLTCSGLFLNFAWTQNASSFSLMFSFILPDKQEQVNYKALHSTFQAP